MHPWKLQKLSPPGGLEPPTFQYQRPAALPIGLRGIGNLSDHDINHITRQNTKV